MASVSSLSGPVTRTFRIHNNARVYSVQVGLSEGTRSSLIWAFILDSSSRRAVYIPTHNSHTC